MDQIGAVVPFEVESTDFFGLERYRNYVSKAANFRAVQFQFQFQGCTISGLCFVLRYPLSISGLYMFS